ncbi:hypothetical protein MAR_021290 [Mya arenaria]|uniref:Uncharacterized protein n=1 Tax=Mya arenaria TaxID=6604 RepID=A0ABY7EFH8_MYAAR|nr:hypothetical protein MAR_021290 [Mya arenaria]
MAGLFRRTLVKLSEHNLKGVPYEVPENWVKSTAGMTIKSTMHHYILLPLHFFNHFWRRVCGSLMEFPEQKWPETRPEI